MTDRDATDDETDGLVVLDEQGRPVTLTMRRLPRRRAAEDVPPPPQRPVAAAFTPAPRRRRAIPIMAGLLATAVLGGAALVLVAVTPSGPSEPPAEATATVVPVPPAPPVVAAPPTPRPTLPPPTVPTPTPATPIPSRPPATVGAAKRVFVHHRAGDAQAAAAARRVADALAAAGFAVPEIRTVPGAVAATRVRFFFDADAEAAATVRTLAARALGRPATGVGVQDFRFYAQKPRADTLEIWVDAP